MKDPWEVEWPPETLTVIGRRVAAKHRVALRDLKSNGKAAPPSRQISDARADFAYQAYKTGKYGLSIIAQWCKITSPYRKQVINNRITNWCKKRGIERPRWGMDSKPFYRLVDNDD